MRKDILLYILIALFMLVCLGAIIFVGFVNSIWVLAIGILGWITSAFACMALMLKITQLRYCRANLTNALSAGMELAHKLGEQQFINQQLLNERNQLLAVMSSGGKIITLEKKKKIKN